MHKKQFLPIFLLPLLVIAFLAKKTDSLFTSDASILNINHSPLSRASLDKSRYPIELFRNITLSEKKFLFDSLEKIIVDSSFESMVSQRIVFNRELRLNQYREIAYAAENNDSEEKEVSKKSVREIILESIETPNQELTTLDDEKSEELIDGANKFTHYGYKVNGGLGLNESMVVLVDHAFQSMGSNTSIAKINLQPTNKVDSRRKTISHSIYKFSENRDVAEAQKEILGSDEVFVEEDLSNSKVTQEVDDDEFVVFDYSDEFLEKDKKALSSMKVASLDSPSIAKKANTQVGVSAEIENSINWYHSKALQYKKDVASAPASGAAQTSQRLAVTTQNDSNKVTQGDYDKSIIDQAQAMLDEAKEDSANETEAKGEYSKAQSSEIETIISAYQFPFAKDEIDSDIKFFNVEGLNDLEVYHSSNEGQVKLFKSIKNTGRLFSKFSSPGMVDVVTPLLLEDNLKQEIPMISEQAYYQNLKKLNIADDSGSMILELDETIENVLIEDKGVRYFYYDNNFQYVETRSLAKFVVILNLRPGLNTVFIETNYGTSSIEFFASPEQFYFLSISESDLETKNFTLVKKMALSEKNEVIDLDSNSITAINSNEDLRKIGIASFQDQMFIKGFSNHYQIKQIGMDIGLTESGKVELPGKDFQSIIFKELDIELNNSCLVQLNISDKEVDEVRFQGSIVQGNRVAEMPLELWSLEDDGKFYKETSYRSKYFFLYGEGKGIIHGSVKYKDGDEANFQATCLENFSVEQL
jgi:hypothetical protein